MTMYVNYCVGFVSLFVFVLWLVYSVFPVTLNRPFLIAPSESRGVTVMHVNAVVIKFYFVVSI
jgi:hypothetical protein